MLTAPRPPARYRMPAIGLSARFAARAAGACLACACATTTAGDFSFVNETAQRLDSLAASDYSFDAMWTDFNGDGCADAWIFAHDDQRTSRLWIDRCDGSHRFELAGNDEVRYAIVSPDAPRGTGWVTLLDLDGDGRQDFWTRDADTTAARYVNATPAGQHLPRFGGKQPACDGGDHCVLADIDGDDRFDVVHDNRATEDALNHRRIAPAAGPAGYRTAADLDGDGWVDLVQPSAGGYWHNARGRLEWRAIAGLTGNTELVLVADFDNDGAMDLLTIGNDHGQRGARLYRNAGGGRFTDVSAASGLDAIGFEDWWTGYGNIIAADLDNDGLQDIVIAGDRHSPSVSLLRNLGGMHFARATTDLGPACTGSTACKSRAAVADFDNDGRLDILKTQAGSNAGLWRNTTDTGSRHWMKVRVRGEGTNADGVGADLTWYASGTDTIVAHMSVQVSNQHPQTWLHTGLGDHARVDLAIRWPHGGPVRRHDGLAADQEVIAWPGGRLVQHWQPGTGWPLVVP